MLHKSTVLLLLVAATFSAESVEIGAYRVEFPELALSKNSDLIEEVRMSTACGHIEGITKIPDDWSISIVRMSVGNDELRATAGHGVTRLSTINKWSVVTVSNFDPSCFDVSARILLTGERPREISLPLSKLLLVPVPVPR